MAYFCPYGKKTSQKAKGWKGDICIQQRDSYLIGALFEPGENTWQITELLPAAKVTAELDNFIAEGGLPKTLDYTNIEDGASAS